MEAAQGWAERIARHCVGQGEAVCEHPNRTGWAERIARHCVGQGEAVCEHPNRTGYYNRACLSALGQMVGQSLECLRKTQNFHWLRREVWRSTAPQHYRRSPGSYRCSLLCTAVLPRVLQVYSFALLLRFN
jgi:hypothetical protein